LALDASFRHTSIYTCALSQPNGTRLRTRPINVSKKKDKTHSKTVSKVITVLKNKKQAMMRRWSLIIALLKRLKYKLVFMINELLIYFNVVFY